MMSLDHLVVTAASCDIYRDVDIDQLAQSNSQCHYLSTNRPLFDIIPWQQASSRTLGHIAALIRTRVVIRTYSVSQSNRNNTNRNNKTKASNINNLHLLYCINRVRIAKRARTTPLKPDIKVPNPTKQPHSVHGVHSVTNSPTQTQK
jgi:hypothetical protein